MKKLATCSVIFYFFILGMFAQELPLILDHPGTFEILTRTNYTAPEFGFSKTEISANLQKITDVVNTVRKNRVLNDMKGFDGRARIYTMGMKDVESYGVPSRISFEFASWFRLKDGKEVRNLIEPPEWSLMINKLVPQGYQFSSYRLSSKPDFFTVPEKKETIEPGIDVYDGECYVVYNPNQPDYWLPVTVKEAFDAVFAENRKVPDQMERDFVLKSLKEEWKAIQQEDWNKPATLSGVISRVGTQTGFPLIMKVNPAYCDKNRPKSDIQFIYFRMIGNKPYLQQNTAAALKNNGIGYALCRFEESLDVEFVKSLLPLIIQ